MGILIHPHAGHQQARAEHAPLMSVDETPTPEPSVALKVNARLHSLVLWENQKETAAVVGLGLLWFVLITWMGYASSTVLCYLALFHLGARFFYQNSTRMLADLKVIEKKPLKEVPTVFVTEEEVMKHLKAITAALNSAIRAAYSLVACDCNAFTLQCMAALWLTALLSKLLGTTGLCFLVFAGVFSVPKVYQLKQAQIDQLLELASEKALTFKDQASAKVGVLLTEAQKKLAALSPPKASDIKAKAL